MPTGGELFQTTPKVDRLWFEPTGDLLGRIYGPLPTKSNSRRLVTFGKRPALIKSKEALDYEERFRVAVLGSDLVQRFANKEEKLFLCVTVWQENLRRDLDCELLPDLLQANRVIVNDRFIWEKHYWRRLDKQNPRVQFTLGLLGEIGSNGTNVCGPHLAKEA